MKIRKNLYLLMVLFILPLAGFGIDIYTPSLPTIAKSLNTSLSSIKMSVTLYLFGLCIGQIFFGVISDVFGRKPVLLISSIGVIFMSVLIPLFQTIEFLIVLRLVQGFFAGGLAVNCRSIIRDVFENHEIPKSSAYMSIAWSMGPIIAPVIGAYLHFYIGWETTFYFLAVYSTAILLVGLNMKETNTNMTTFSIRQLFRDYASILSNINMIGMLLLMTVGYSIPILFSLVAPFLVQDGLNLTTITYGQSAFWIGIAFLFGTLVNRVLLQFVTADNLIQYSFVGIFVSSIILLVVTIIFNQSLFNFIAAMFLMITLVGIAFPNCLGKSISLLPTMAGKVSAVIGSGFMFLTSIITIIVNYISIDNQTTLAIIFLILSTMAIVVIYALIKPVINLEFNRSV